MEERENYLEIFRNCEDTTKFNMRQIINGLLNYFILINKNGMKELLTMTKVKTDLVQWLEKLFKY